MNRSHLLAPLVEAPEAAAILLDLDGTLAPIVSRPEQASVPEETRTEVRRLAGRYALVACISGRTAEDAARLLDVAGVVYVGVHGLELSEEAAAWRAPVQELARNAEWPVENKGLTIAFHFRETEDEPAARAELQRIATDAQARGLEPRWGRKVLEIRPPVDADKGTAVRQLLDERSLSRALYAGDDTTDLDAFRGLEECDLAIRVAVGSAEGPAELRAQADLIVDSPSELLALLREL